METHTNTKEDKEDKFRVAGKILFLTYPQCPVTKEDGLAQLQAKLPIEKACIGHEFHKDDGDHLHCYLRLTQRVDIKNKYFLDIKYGDTLYHGNYQVARNPIATLRYCTKDGDFLEYNMDAKHELEARESKKKILGAELITTPVHNLVQNHPELLYEYEKIRRNQNSYWLDKCEPHVTDGVRGIWLYGPPGTGKSRAGNTIAQKLYKEDAYIKPQSKWWDGYTGQKVVMLDDLDFLGGQTLGHYIKRWADRHAVTGEIKGSTINCQHDIFIITSNYTIQQLYGPTPDDKPEVASTKTTLVRALEDRF